MKKRFLSFLLATMVMSTVAFTGCGSSSGSKDKKDAKSSTQSKGNKKYKIVVMPKLVGIPYFNASQKGAEDAGKDLGVEVIYTGPTTADAAAQVKMIEDAISRGVDCIAVAPNDAAALTPALKKAKSKGILVMDWDSAADKSVVDLSVHQIDDTEYGEHSWDKLVEAMGTDEGEYAVITGGLSATNLNAWIDAGIAYGKKKYPKLKLVTERIPSDEKQQIAYEKTLQLIKAYPNLKGIIGESTPAPIGIAQAIQEKGLQNKIAAVGCTLPSQSKAYLKDGSLDTAILWDPVKLGYLTVYLAKEKLDGKEIKDGMDVKNVGKIKVLQDGKTIIMGSPLDINKGNVDGFGF